MAGDSTPDVPDDRPAEKPDEPTREKPSGGDSRVTPAANQLAEFLLGALLWAWIGLPFLKGGPTAVKNTLRAKFFNKGPDGKWLP